jgi:hypothetical protein
MVVVKGIFVTPLARRERYRGPELFIKSDGNIVEINAWLHLLGSL